MYTDGQSIQNRDFIFYLKHSLGKIFKPGFQVYTPATTITKDSYSAKFDIQERIS